MKKIKYLNNILLTTGLILTLTGCGDAKESEENSVKAEEKSSLKTTPSKPFIKKYAVENAIINYTITGSMDLMGSTSKTTGTKKLTFSQYGSHELTEINTVEEQNIMNNPKTIKKHTLDYIKEATLYQVDYPQKSIQRLQVPALAMMMGTGDENMLKKGQRMMENMGGKRLGMDKVLGYDCEVWSLMGTKQCLYKGIPLKVETNIMGVSNLEVANKIDFESSIKPSAYQLPDFPVTDTLNQRKIDKSKLAEMDANDKKNALENASRMKELVTSTQKAQATIEAHPNMSKKEQEEVLQELLIESMGKSKGIQSQLDKQKEMMPKIITLIKSYRDCLQKADSKSDALSCDSEVEALAKKIEFEEDFSEEEKDPRAWTKEGRRAIIDEMNEELKMLEQTLPCIEKAKTMMDVMNCNQ